MSTTLTPKPSRGEVWLATLDPVRENEQGGTRPVVVIRANKFNHGRARLTIVVPITKRERSLPWHVAIDSPDGGIRQRSFANVKTCGRLPSDGSINVGESFPQRQ